METDIEEGFELARSGSHHDQGFVSHLVNHVITDIGDLLEATRHLPGAGPHPICFEPIKVRREVSRAIEVLVAERIVAIFA